MQLLSRKWKSLFGVNLLEKSRFRTTEDYSAILLHVLYYFINPLTANVPHHIKTTQLICIANQLTGFSMIGNNGR